MRNKNKLSGKTMGIPGGLAIGTLLSIVITISGAMIIAALLNTEKVGEGSTGFLTMIIHGISSISGAWAAMALVKRLRLQICILTGVCYYLILLGMTALFFDGQYSGLGLTALIVLLGCGFVAFFPTKNRIRGKKRIRAYR